MSVEKSLAQQLRDSDTTPRKKPAWKRACWAALQERTLVKYVKAAEFAEVFPAHAVKSPLDPQNEQDTRFVTSRHFARGREFLVVSRSLNNGESRTLMVFDPDFDFAKNAYSPSAVSIKPRDFFLYLGKNEAGNFSSFLETVRPKEERHYCARPYMAAATTVTFYAGLPEMPITSVSAFPR